MKSVKRDGLHTQHQRQGEKHTQKPYMYKEYIYSDKNESLKAAVQAGAGR